MNLERFSSIQTSANQNESYKMSSKITPIIILRGTVVYNQRLDPYRKKLILKSEPYEYWKSKPH
jgi:hypothetical protein